MPTAAEAAGSAGPLAAPLKAGLRVLDQDAVVTFTRYHRLVLPLDGFVFWVKADLLSASALFNTQAMSSTYAQGGFNAFAFNRPRAILVPATTIEAKGSLHWAQHANQDQDEAYTLNQIIFTSEVEVEPLNERSPQVMYMATVEGVRYSFSARESFYEQADLYHYRGDAVFPVLETQIIDSPAGFDSHAQIVSNSLPFWLALDAYCPVYPSYLIDANVRPPYAAVHIDPEYTEGLASAPALGPTMSHTQLAHDRVRVSLFGLNNDRAMDYLDAVYAFTMVRGDTMGVMNVPVVRDAKRTQNELGAIAQKKQIEFEVSYLQHSARDIARQLITRCVPSYSIDGVNWTVPAGVVYSENIALPYSGPFQADERLPAYVVLQATTITRGVAYTYSTGNGTIELYKNDSDGEPTILVAVVTCVSGDNNPQVTFPNGPTTLYINDVLVPFAIDCEAGLVDLTITIGGNPPS